MSGKNDDENIWQLRLYLKEWEECERDVTWKTYRSTWKYRFWVKIDKNMNKKYLDWVWNHFFSFTQTVNQWLDRLSACRAISRFARIVFFKIRLRLSWLLRYWCTLEDSSAGTISFDAKHNCSLLSYDDDLLQFWTLTDASGVLRCSDNRLMTMCSGSSFVLLLSWTSVPFAVCDGM